MGVWLLRVAGFCQYDDPFQAVINVAVECRMGSVGFSMVNFELEREFWAER